MDREQKIDKIYDAIVGDEFNDGIIKKIDDVKSRVDKLETFRNRFIYVASGAGIAGGIALDKVWAVLKHVFIGALLFFCVACRTTQRTLDVAKIDSLHIEDKKITTSSLAKLKINDAITLEGDVVLHADGTITSQRASVNRELKSETATKTKEETKEKTKVEKLDKHETKKTVSPFYLYAALAVGLFLLILAVKSRLKL